MHHGSCRNQIPSLSFEQLDPNAWVLTKEIVQRPIQLNIQPVLKGLAPGVHRSPRKVWPPPPHTFSCPLAPCPSFLQRQLIPRILAPGAGYGGAPRHQAQCLDSHGSAALEDPEGRCERYRGDFGDANRPLLCPNATSWTPLRALYGISLDCGCFVGGQKGIEEVRCRAFDTGNGSRQPALSKPQGGSIKGVVMAAGRVGGAARGKGAAGVVRG